MRYLKTVLQKNRCTLTVCLGLGIFNSFMAIYKVSYFQKLVDGLAGGNLPLGPILTYGLIMAVLYLMNYIDNYPSEKLSHSLFLDFKLLALEKSGSILYAGYQKIGTGRLVQVIENGAQAGRDMLAGFWLQLFRELAPTVVFSVYFIWQASPLITCVLLSGYAVIFLVTNFLLRSLYQLKERILNNEELLNHFLVRGLMEMVVFRLERQFPTELQKARRAKGDIVDSKVKMTLIHEAFFTIFVLLVALLDVGILWFAWYTHSLSVGTVVALISLIESAYMPIAIFNGLFVQYKLNRAAFSRLQNFLEQEDDPRLEQGLKLEALDGDVEISGLSFAYEGRDIFQNLDLHIRPKEKVAFVGESGSGKSTLVKLLAGLLKYPSGSVRLDGHELSLLNLNSLYQHICYFSQDPPVFDGTLRENLVFDQNIADAPLLEALRRVQLSHLAQGPQGLALPIGERGTSLSGGEKQRLALARLLLQNPQLVLLDEGTSAMDNLTEEFVMNQLISLLENCTVIAVAHRLSSIAGFDRIVVFRQGRIVAQGSYQQLMTHSPYFAQLYTASVREPDSPSLP